MAARKRDVTVAGYGMATALGGTAEKTWAALLAGKTAPAPDTRFYPPGAAQCFPVGVVAAADSPGATGRSRFMRILSGLLPAMRAVVPRDAKLILATTVGEIDLLEAALLGNGAGDGAAPRDTLAHVRAAMGLERPGLLLSAACASSTAALAAAAQWIASGRGDCVCVLGCDALSEFVCSGFLSLQALSSGPPRPFMPDRDGLNLGEAAGFMLLMPGARARAEKRRCHGRLAGWGSSCDAFHATTPDPGGKGLARAIRAALACADCAPARIAAICAHGTATPSNDEMEARAFATVFNNTPPPFFSAKGAMGHTLGAAGVVEAILALLAHAHGRVPPTAGNAGLPRRDTAGDFTLTTNSGFGGVNTALVFQSNETFD